MKFKVESILPHLALLGATLIYGANYTIAKDLLDGNSILPMGLVLLRVLTALVFFFSIHLFFVRESIEKTDMVRLAISGLFGVVLNQSFFIAGLKYTTPINASVLMVTTPILVLVISALVNKEKISYLKSLGIVLGASGTLFLVMNKGKFSFDGNFKGDIFIMINAFSYAVYLVLVKPLMEKYSPITIMKWIFFFGLLPVIPMGIRDATRVNWEAFTVNLWMALFYVLFFTTVLAYLFNATALKRVNPSTVGVYIYLQPVLATVIALMAGKDSLTGSKLVSAALIITGVYLVSFKKSKKN